MGYSLTFPYGHISACHFPSPFSNPSPTPGALLPFPFQFSYLRILVIPAFCFFIFLNRPDSIFKTTQQVLLVLPLFKKSHHSSVHVYHSQTADEGNHQAAVGVKIIFISKLYTNTPEKKKKKMLTVISPPATLIGSSVLFWIGGLWPLQHLIEE